MQKIEFANKKIVTSNNKKTNQNQVSEVVIENMREKKGEVLAISRNVFRILNSDTYYVKSETNNNLYYFVKYNPSVFEWCCCPDNSTRHVKCKHIFAIEFAIRMGTLKDIDKLPVGAKRYPTIVSKSSSYEKDEYSF